MACPGDTRWKVGMAGVVLVAPCVIFKCKWHVSGSYGLFCHCSSGSKKPIVGNNLD